MFIRLKDMLKTLAGTFMTAFSLCSEERSCVLILPVKGEKRQAVVAQAFDPSTLEAAGGSL